MRGILPASQFLRPNEPKPGHLPRPQWKRRALRLLNRMVGATTSLGASRAARPVCGLKRVEPAVFQVPARPL